MTHWYKNATVSAKMTTKDLTSVSYNGKILCAIYIACMHNFAFIIVWPFCHLLRHLSPLRPCTCRNPEGPQSCKVLQLGPFRGFGWEIFGVFHLQCRLTYIFFLGNIDLTIKSWMIMPFTKPCLRISMQWYIILYIYAPYQGAITCYYYIRVQKPNKYFVLGETSVDWSAVTMC